MQFPMEIFKPWYFSLLAASLIFIVAVSAVDPLTEALLSLKSEIIDESSNLNDWILPSGASSSAKIVACSWSGVKCSENSSMVIGLDLSMKNLGGVLTGKQFNLFVDLLDLNLSHNSFSGQLPLGVFNLTNLRSLDVGRNNFSGHFPSGVSNLHNLVVLDAFSNSFSGPLPAGVSQIDSLKVLNFAGSYFSESIPSEYGSFKSLEFIHLAGNFLCGNIPPELGNLKTLSHMEIGYNSYEGGIPWELGNLTQMQYLDIAGANLSGPIPKELSNITKLESLFLFRNDLSGTIPFEFSKIISLRSLDLSDNLLSGHIPESFSELKNLRLLSLMYNDLNGTVPDSIGELPQLETLLLWDNLFSGILPENLGRFSDLKYVDVSTNNFIGDIPQGICSRGMLMKLILFSNNLTGGLSPLSNCSSLIRIRLEDNSFSGEVSLNFSNLPDITYVDLSRNKFTAGIPSNLAHSAKLEYLNLSYNHELGGSVPEGIWSVPMLQNLSAINCSLSGRIPAFGICKSLSVIELSTNNLLGMIPDGISNCQSLTRMDLGWNNLTGHIPEEIAGLPVLSFLDLSHNSFNGQIPASFRNSSNLKLLNISFNDISGLIPPERNFRMMDSSAFMGNPKLCGQPLRSCNYGGSMPTGLELESKKTQKVAWILIICAVIVLLIITATFGVLYLRRGLSGQWKMVSFNGLPRFTANDVLRSFNSTETINMVPQIPDSVCKAVLPTGITVTINKLEWGSKQRNIMSQFISRLGHARHKNLTRLLGFCYNDNVAYLLYDYLPNGNLAEKIRVKRDWATKYRIIVGTAKALCFLHHDCYPAIPHGDLKASNIMFDENLEPHLAEYGLKLAELNSRSQSGIGSSNSGQFIMSMKEELDMDIHNFGEIIMAVLTNGKHINAAMSLQSSAKDALLREILYDTETGPSSQIQEEIELVLEVALRCTRGKPSDRPSMEEALKLLSSLKSQLK